MKANLTKTIPLCTAALTAFALSLSAQTPSLRSLTDVQGRGNLVAPGDPIIMHGAALSRGLTGVGQPPGLSLTVGGKVALIRSFSPATIEAVLPYDVPTGTQPVALTGGGTPILSTTIRVAKVAPNLLTNDWSAAGPGMIIRYQATPNMLPSGATVIQYPRPTAQAPAIPGESVWLIATGLGVTNPSTPSREFPAQPNKIAAPVQLAAAGRQMELVNAFIEPEGYWPVFKEINGYTTIMGLSRVYFRIPKDMPEGTHMLSITADGVTGNSVQLIVGKPRTLVTSIWTSTNRWAGIAPGALLSIYGINFGGATATGGFSSFKAGDVSVEMDGRPIAVLGVYEPQGQINVVTPMDLPADRRITVTVKTPQGNLDHPAYSYQILPSLFKLADPGDSKRSFAIATLANTVWLPLPAGVAEQLKIPTNCAVDQISPLSTCAAPVKPGDILQIYTTGLGKATSDGTASGQMVANGAIAPADGSVLYKVVAPFTVTVGGVGAEVLYAGLAPGFAGLYQLNVRIPAAAAPGDAVPLEISGRLGTQTIADSAMIAVSAQ